MVHFTDPRDLREALLGLFRIKQAGRLSDLYHSINAAMREASFELDHCTLGESLAVSQLAELAASVLGIDLAVCTAAAKSLVLRTRFDVALELIRQYVAELDDKLPNAIPSDTWAGSNAMRRAHVAAVSQLAHRRRGTR